MTRTKGDGLCPICRDSKRHVWPSGRMSSYCIGCGRKKAKERYHDDPSILAKACDYLKKKYARDPVYRERVKRASREYMRKDGHYDSDRFRLSAIRCHVRRLSGKSLQDLKRLMSEEAGRRKQRGP